MSLLAAQSSSLPLTAAACCWLLALQQTSAAVSLCSAAGSCSTGSAISAALSLLHLLLQPASTYMNAM
jgi:hypothetical protein